LADAEAAIRNVLELEPNNAPVWNWLGRIARSRDHVVESEQYLRKAVVLQPETASFWLDLGTTLCDMGNWDDAVIALLKAHSLDPQNAVTLSNLAVATLRVATALLLNARSGSLSHKSGSGIPAVWIRASGFFIMSARRTASMSVRSAVARVMG
jgi:cytochrome c-type biogenesis protein CcmH/NrfG